MKNYPSDPRKYSKSIRPELEVKFQQTKNGKLILNSSFYIAANAIVQKEITQEMVIAEDSKSDNESETSGKLDHKEIPFLYPSLF